MTIWVKVFSEKLTVNDMRYWVKDSLEIKSFTKNTSPNNNDIIIVSKFDDSHRGICF